MITAQEANKLFKARLAELKPELEIRFLKKLQDVENAVFAAIEKAARTDGKNFIYWSFENDKICNYVVSILEKQDFVVRYSNNRNQLYQIEVSW